MRHEPLYSFIYSELLRVWFFMLTFVGRSITTLVGGVIASGQIKGIKKAPEGAFLLQVKLTDELLAFHIRTQHFWDLNTTVSLLVIFQYGDKRTTHGQTGTVQRMHQTGFLI